MNIEKELIEKTKNIVTIVVLTLTFTWGIYTFVVVEYILPRTAPMSVNLTVDYKIINERNSNGLIPVEVEFTATNNASRKVGLAGSTYLAKGMKYVNYDNVRLDIKEYTKDNPIRSNTFDSASYATKKDNDHLIGIGSIFIDDTLNPFESISRKITLFIDERDKLNVLNITGHLQVVKDNNNYLSKTYFNDDEELITDIYKVNGNNKLILLDENKREKLGIKSVINMIIIAL